jgi:phosphomannomutase
LYVLHAASHLPYNRNGFKFFTNAGGLGKADIKDILERAADIYNNFTENGLMNSKEKASASIRRVDYMTIYTSDLVKAVRKAAGNIGIISIKYFIEVEMFEIKISFSHYSKLIIDRTYYPYSVPNIP